ncbi:MAG: toxin-antitoxin system, toxin component [Chloroflexus sp.]
MHADSDIAILIVVLDGIHRRHTAQHLYHDLMALGIAKDLIVATESAGQRYSDDPLLVLYPALHEGKERYAAKR